MQYVEVNKTRRIVGRFDSQQSFNCQLNKLCKKEEIRCGYIRATGAFSSVTWIDDDEGSKETLSISNEAEKIFLLSLEGTIAPLNKQVVLDAKVSLHYSKDATGKGVVGGQLIDGEPLAVDFVLMSYDDLALERYKDRKTGGILIDYSQQGETAEQFCQDGTSNIQGRPEGEDEVKEVGALSTWKTAARQAGALLEQLDTPSVELRTGDILMHPVLGECKVVKIEGDSIVYIRIRNSRKLSKLSLDYIDLKLKESVGVTRVFQVEVGRS
jgi:predicted DNA-binding protein with PD1-like motif